MSNLIKRPEPNMPELLYGKTETWEKFMGAFLIIFMIAFFISLPFMWRDQQARLDHEWKTQGCEMYDDYLIKDVPSKCQTFFIDHYKNQTPRVQPPDVKQP